MSSEMDNIEPFPGQEPSHLNGQDQPRRSNPVYELFVLGELISSPTYGYKLNEIINRILGPYQQLSWGTLYPLIRRLEREGLVTVAKGDKQSKFQAVERGQPRRVYAITEAGRERFFELMLSPQSYTYHPDLFAVQLTKFEYLSPEQRLNQLRRYQSMLQDLHKFYQKMRPLLEKKPEFREEERPYILQLVTYRIHMLKAELEWFEQTISGEELSHHQATREE